MDHDQVAATARRQRLATDIDRVRSLVAGHGDEHPDWTEVAVLLDRLRATLARDLAPLPRSHPSRHHETWRPRQS